MMPLDPMACAVCNDADGDRKTTVDDVLVCEDCRDQCPTCTVCNLPQPEAEPMALWEDEPVCVQCHRALVDDAEKVACRSALDAALDLVRDELDLDDAEHVRACLAAMGYYPGTPARPRRGRMDAAIRELDKAIREAREAVEDVFG